ncbi:ribose ABC transport system, permease protein RbsC [Vibrio sp. JCM 19052]|nr:ribose ABC transport system, permease protein RbsC [Vibrio sp. JCM 19052]
MLAVAKNGLTLLGVPSYWHTVVTGLIIVCSISMTAINEKNKRYKRHKPWNKC